MLIITDINEEVNVTANATQFYCVALSETPSTQIKQRFIPKITSRLFPAPLLFMT
jgi:hypothetical protein